MIWPIFHYIPRNVEYSESDWEAYLEANLQFASKLLEVTRPGDSIWIHDYHLFLEDVLNLKEFGQRKVYLLLAMTNIDS